MTKFHSPAQLIMPSYDVRRGDHLLCSAIEQMALWGSNAYTSASRFLAGQVATHLRIFGDVRVVPNGIDLNHFDTADTVDARRRFDLPANRLMIFFSGRMERRKGIHLCPEIVGSILERHDVAFVFAGQDLFDFMSGTMQPALNARRLRGSFHYLGKLTLPEVGSCLRQADIFMLPSIWENCPYSCLEAMAAGRAIVSSDAGGLPELIRDGENGLLAESGRASSFIAALDRLIADRNLRDRLGAEARRTLEASFTDVQIAERSVAVYQECLERYR